MEPDKKQQRYQRIYQQLSEVLTVTGDAVARMATVVGLLHHKMDYFFWTGFYRLVDGELLVGPYQGSVACQKLKKGAGVCWVAVQRDETIVVPDVSKFAGHIACDSRSCSEIVVPCRDGEGRIAAVLDVDSVSLGSFDEIDAVELEAIVRLI